ncbi:MAG TPA: pyridoxal-dependent decarboxylase [Steroidobacteraceae bacterium]|nr:pyridoxal-dependent decarboxylase [Steroidobacteraceae bacterium]
MAAQNHDPTDFSEALQAAAACAMEYLSKLAVDPVGARTEAAVLRQRLAKPLARLGLPAEQVIRDLVADVDGGLHGVAGGRFFAWVIGGAVPAALAADWLTSAWDQNAHNYGTAPAAAIAEEAAGAWLRELFGLPPRSSFALVTGCQMAHFTCMAAARHALLAQRGWDVEANGLAGGPRLRVVASDLVHGSIDRALSMVGIGKANLVRLPTDEQGRLRSAALEATLAAQPETPTIVVLLAGDLNMGAFDPFEILIPIARRFRAWVHVDGAFGLWAAATPTHRHRLAGVAAADSWATDGHKWLNVPYDCGYAFVADPRAHSDALAHRATYISYSSEARDQADWNPEWSRRARGFASYAAIRQLGSDGIAALIDRCCEHAHALATGIGRLAGAELLWEPTINQGLVRFLDPKPGAALEDHDRRTDAVIKAINTRGEAFFSGTTWRGQRAMRISVCNWQTSAADIERAVRSVADVICSSEKSIDNPN